MIAFCVIVLTHKFKRHLLMHFCAMGIVIGMLRNRILELDSKSIVLHFQIVLMEMCVIVKRY